MCSCQLLVCSYHIFWGSCNFLAGWLLKLLDASSCPNNKFNLRYLPRIKDDNGKSFIQFNDFPINIETFIGFGDFPAMFDCLVDGISRLQIRLMRPMPQTYHWGTAVANHLWECCGMVYNLVCHITMFEHMCHILFLNSPHYLRTFCDVDI